MEYIALGCMSGTSLDGIDCSLVKSDGVSYVTDISNEFIPYSDDLQLKLRNVILKGYLDDTKVINQLNQEYKDSINNFIKKNNFEIDIIAIHGQTIYHDQKTKISIQLFDKSIRFNTNSPVICNFRKNDLLNGGNGAPIMPEFHRVLANQLDLKKVIFVNIGGVTNITVIDNQKITAGDSSFGNAIVNDLIYESIFDNMKNNENIIIGGDFNIIPSAEDVHNPKSYENDALFRLEIRKKLRELINLGFHDAYRFIHPEKEGYTFWDYTSGAWQKNNGMRIDHFLVSSSLIGIVKDVKINKFPRGRQKPSDHTPIEIELA